MNWRWFSWIGLLAIVAFKAAVIFWQFDFNSFLVAPGGDLINHIQYAENIGQIKQFGYPPLFHWLLIQISRLTNWDLVTATKNLAPYIFILPTIGIFLLAKKLFDSTAAFWTVIIMTFVSAWPILSFADGTYPDIINYGLFVPLAMIFLISALENGRWYNIFCFGLMVSLMIFTHHLSTILGLAVMGLFLLISMVVVKNYPWKNFFRLFGGIALFSLFWFFLLRLTFGQGLWEALKNLFQEGIGPVNHPIASQPLSYDNIFTIIKPLILFLGFSGLIIFIPTIQKKPMEKNLIFIWVVVAWILSRFVWSGLPPRFLRELDLPLLIAAGFFLSFIIQSCRSVWQKTVIYGLTGYLILINTVQLFQPPFLLPDGLKKWVWYNQIDAEKRQYINQSISKEKKIATNNSNPYLNYYLRKDGFTLILPAIADIPQKPEVKDNKKIDDFNKKLDIEVKYFCRRGDYLFIGAKPYSDLNEVVFAEFNGYTEITNFLNNCSTGRKPIKQFLDGSALYQLYQ